LGIFPEAVAGGWRELDLARHGDSAMSPKVFKRTFFFDGISARVKSAIAFLKKE
jgi:hypothetical protein